MTVGIAELHVCVPIREEADVAVARKRARAIGLQAGLLQVGVEAVATAVSEIARNIVVHARVGEMDLRVMQERGRQAVVVVARDDGPGIADLELAMQDGYSTAGSLGLGLSSARRLMDEFELVSTVTVGTIVTMKKWA
jgi:serine/threonine-protein kinase RsbT